MRFAILIHVNFFICLSQQEDTAPNIVQEPVEINQTINENIEVCSIFNIKLSWLHLSQENTTDALFSKPVPHMKELLLSFPVSGMCFCPFFLLKYM